MKNAITYSTAEEQIELLVDKGLSFDNKELAKYNLNRYGYYNIINSYKKPYQIVQDGKKVYVPGVTFEQIFSMFTLDHNLRNSIMASMLDLEEYLRAATAEIIARNFGTNHNDYLQFKNYRDRSSKNTRFSLNGVLGTLRNNAASDKDPIKYYRETYNCIPPWILLKGTYFSTLVNFIKCLKNTQKQQLVRMLLGISENYNLPEGIIDLVQILLFGCLSYRNTAAHGGRIYNFQSPSFNNLVVSEEIINNFPSLHGINDSSGVNQLVQLLTILAYDHPRAVIHSSINQEVNRHLKIYPSDIDRLSSVIGVQIVQTQYFWINENSHIYHSVPTCSGMSHPKKINISSLDKNKYCPCKRCIK